MYEVMKYTILLMKIFIIEQIQREYRTVHFATKKKLRTKHENVGIYVLQNFKYDLIILYRLYM